MDESLLAWYNVVDCGLFEFKNHPLENAIDYFTVKIRNVNSGYLSLIFDIKLKNDKKEKFNQIIDNNYYEDRGYAFQTLTGNSKTTGAFKNYSIARYNDNSLKADKIYEFISYIEWEFLEELSSLFPFVFHNKKVSPPRIEVYSTNIDWRDDNRYFWHSIGVEDYQGQFVDERQKMFFKNTLSERYGRLYASNRLIYIFKDDGIEIGQFESIKDRVYYHIKEYAIDYFKFMFLDMLSREAGKTLVEYKHKLDKIKLKRNNLESHWIINSEECHYKFTIEVNDRFKIFKLPYRLQSGIVIKQGYKTTFPIDKIINYMMFVRKIQFSEDMINSKDLMEKKSALDFIIDALQYLISTQGDSRNEQYKTLALSVSDNMDGKVYAVVKKELEELMKLSNEYFDVRHNDYLNAAKEKREALNDSLFIEYLYNRAYAMLYLLRLKHKETNECE